MKKTKIKLKNFEILIKGLKSLKRREWYFGSLIREYSSEKGCGTVCCALGWLPKFFPRKMEWVNHSPYFLDARRKGKEDWSSSNIYSYLFGIPSNHEDALFNNDSQYTLGLKNLAKDCTVLEFIKMLREYIKKVKKGDYEEVSV